MVEIQSQKYSCITRRSRLPVFRIGSRAGRGCPPPGCMTMLARVGIAPIRVKVAMPDTPKPVISTSQPLAISPATRPIFSIAMKYPLEVSWSGRELIRERAAGTNSPAPIPSITRNTTIRRVEVVSVRSTPEATVSRRPPLTRGSSPARSAIRPAGRTRRNAPRKYAE